MQFNVVVGLPLCTVGGVTTFVTNLVRHLNRQNIPAHILWTCPEAYDSKPLPMPPDILVRKGPWMDNAAPRIRWQALIRYLEGLAPCIYLPNNDFWHSCISAKLSDRVAIVGHIHTDFSQEYEHFAWLGRYWNATVAVSALARKKAASLHPQLAQRLTTIPYGVPTAQRPAKPAAAANEPLQIIYSGRLIQEQKRIFDLPKIVEELARRKVPVRLNIVGGGWQEPDLKASCQHLVAQGLVRFLGVLPQEQLPAVYHQNDVFILTSDYEGLPLSLLEAMGHGCVPVVTDIPSGIPEVLREGINGHLVPVGAAGVFADRLETLYSDPLRRHQLAQNAFATISEGGYRIEDMTARYIDLFRDVWRKVESGAFHRPRGRVRMPPFMGTWKDRLPAPLRVVGIRCKRLIRRVCSTAW